MFLFCYLPGLWLISSIVYMYYYQFFNAIVLNWRYFNPVTAQFEWRHCILFTLSGLKLAKLCMQLVIDSCQDLRSNLTLRVKVVQTISGYAWPIWRFISFSPAHRTFVLLTIYLGYRKFTTDSISETLSKKIVWLLSSNT